MDKTTKTAYNPGTIYGIGSEMVDPEISRVASEYMINHYSEIVTQAKKMGICDDKAFDIVHDVYISMVNAENNGEGYDMSKGNSGSIILVNQFVYGRLKRYSKNKKYYATSTDEISASNSSDDFDSMDNFQKAYAVAGEYDELDIIEDSLSIADEIEYCIGFESVVGLNIKALLTNLHILNDTNIDKTLFNDLRNATKYHNEFGEAFKHIITFAGLHKDAFNRILETI